VIVVLRGNMKFSRGHEEMDQRLGLKRKKETYDDEVDVA
jgi:hypothetical protein